MSSRITGPLCRELGYWVHDVDDGTLPRMVSPTPCPIGMDLPGTAGPLLVRGNKLKRDPVVPTTRAKSAPAGPTSPGTASGGSTATAAGGAAPAEVTIELPLDVYLVNLKIMQDAIEPYEVRVGKETRTQERRVRKVAETVPSGQAEKSVRMAIDRTNEIWKPAGIAFRLSKCIPKDVEFESKVVSEQGFFSLVTALKLPRTGLSVMFVGKFDGQHLGGRAVESLGAGIVTNLVNPTLGNVLAHELGHLLGLPDLKHVDGSVEHNYNLMYEAIPAGYGLTAGQIETAIAKAKTKVGK